MDDIEMSVKATEVTIENSGVRVEMEFIGEGVSGDYDESDPMDEPLLRFTVSRMADGSWIQVDDASYCTNLNARLPESIVRLAAQHIMNCVREDVLEGHGIKRICEHLSWIDETVFGTAKKREIVIIAAVAENMAIGLGGGLVCSIPEDMARFKALTMGNPVIMGRKTWESLPVRWRPLVRRRNLVISSNPDYVAPGAEVVTSLDAALRRTESSPLVFIIGGAQIYREALPLATTLELTHVAGSPSADSFFPDVDMTEWKETSRYNHDGFSFATYKRA